MLKKIFFLLSILLLITGCDAIYSLNLENNKFQENLEISEKYNSHEITNFKEIVDVAVTGAITLD